MNEPAFPHTHPFPPRGDGYSPGLTIRDYFAAQVASTMLHICQSEGECGYSFSTVAQNSYELADAMIAAREQVTLSHEAAATAE